MRIDGDPPAVADQNPCPCQENLDSMVHALRLIIPCAHLALSPHPPLPPSRSAPACCQRYLEVRRQVQKYHNPHRDCCWAGPLLLPTKKL